MPPPKTIIVDPNAILLAIFEQVEPIRSDLEAIVAAAEVEYAQVNFDRNEKFQKAKGEEAAGMIIDWPEFFRLNPLVYQYDLQKLRRQLAAIEGGWIAYSLEMFSGRDDLSESEKQAWRRAVRELEAAGLIERSRREVRLTPDGLAHLRKTLAAQIEVLDDAT